MSSLPPPRPHQERGGPPPAPPTYDYGYQQRTYAPIGRLARAMLILLAIDAALQIVLLPVLFAVHGKAQDFLDGRISDDTFEEALTAQSAVASVQGGVTIAIAVLTMVWMYRMLQNHRALGRPGSRWSPGWAIGGWFVPPGFVYAVPWLVFCELWKGSDPANTPNDLSWTRRAVAPIVHVWWVLFGLVPIAGVVVGVSLFTVSFGERDLDRFADRLDSFFVLQFVLGVVGVVTCGVYAKLVHELTRRQQALTGER